MRRVLIFGPTSWDTVIEIPKYPENGGFAQAINRKERPGGAGMNVAVALATSGIETGLYSYVGDDGIGSEILNYLKNSHIGVLQVKTLPGPSLQAMIAVDRLGERTIFALEQNRFQELEFELEFTAHDIVTFPVWRSFYTCYLKQARNAGAFTVVGPGAVDDDDLKADLIVGSERDHAGFDFDAGRFGSALITRGSGGVEIMTAEGSIMMPAIETRVKDATGAGDAFLAGALVGMAKGYGLQVAVEIGIRWATAAITQYGSVPPDWDESFRTG